MASSQISSSVSSRLVEEILALDRRALDRARLSRDPRFDGKFFIAVKSTGIYCRPICPSPTSKIDNGFLDQRSVDKLADRLGIGARHLHRLFVQHVGASPVSVAQTRRLHFAKRLLDETQLPITEIALAAGFGSVRRFNSAFHQTYGRAPRELRRQRYQSSQEQGEVVLRLSFRPPYDWEQVADF